MENRATIERFGALTKEEKLTTTDPSLFANKYQVYESRAPFFNYYEDSPGLKLGTHVYLELEGYHSFETILRATLEIKKMVDFKFYATLGYLTYQNTTYQVIRLLGVDSYEKVSELQGLYELQVVRLKRSHTKLNDQMVVIRLEKFLHLKEVEGGTYFFDDAQPQIGYFKVPEYISWEKFKTLTREVKYETSLLFFDAATAYFYQNREIVNLVRIFKNDNSTDKLEAIRERYLKLLNANRF
jgi:hypothetical protein